MVKILKWKVESNNKWKYDILQEYTLEVPLGAAKMAPRPHNSTNIFMMIPAKTLLSLENLKSIFEIDF